jgi:hypothetical protein
MQKCFKPLSSTLKVVKWCLVWWCVPSIIALGRLRQEDGEFKASQDCLVHHNFRL